MSICHQSSFKSTPLFSPRSNLPTRRLNTLAISDTSSTELLSYWLKFPESSDLFFVLVSPDFEAPTKKMRAALPSEIPMADHVWNSTQGGALVAAIMEGDIAALGKAMSGDRIVEPRTGPLIPGFREVKEAAIGAGAYGCTISGAGPTVVAITDGEERGREIGDRMVEAFLVGGGLKAKAVVSRLDRVGVRIVSSKQ